MTYRQLSLWHETADDSWEPRPGLRGDRVADVAIVGAGLTGLWTAYYLAQARPDLDIVVLEKEVAGFGASGRNGGWCSALFPASLDTLTTMGDRDSALAQHQAMRDTVDEVAKVVATREIDADLAKGGTITLARTPAQWSRAVAEVEHARSWGRGDGDLALLDEHEARSRLNATNTVGGTYTPDCAAVHPAKLVRGLARVVESLGVTVLEHTRVTGIAPHSVTATTGTVTADYIIRATEGYTSSIAGYERAMIPVYSLIVATEPLPGGVWDEIGLAERETFSDFRHLLIYGQRTADDRLVFGGRGAPYHFGSRIAPGYDRDPRVFRKLHESLVDMFPMLSDVAITHQWGGALGIPRDWRASVNLDVTTGIGHAGGYVGDGVATTNLAGRTLRDLVLGHTTELTALPWVGHRSPDWEPEPWRWLGVNAGLNGMTFADTEERLTKRPSLVAKALSPLLG